MKKYVKNHKSRLTARRSDAIVCVTGLNNPFDCGRCFRHGGNLRNNHKHTCILAGLREPVRVIVWGAAIDVLFTPSQARSFYASKQGTKGGNSNDRNDRRSACTTTTPRPRTLTPSRFSRSRTGGNRKQSPARSHRTDALRAPAASFLTHAVTLKRPIVPRSNFKE